MATISNANVELFGVGTAGDDPTWVSLWTLETGGTFLARLQITGNPAALTAGDRFSLPAGSLALSVTAAGGLRDEIVALLMTAARSGGFGLWAQLHDGDPGSSGTASALAGTGRIEVEAWMVTAA